jgi:hypothetical protein
MLSASGPWNRRPGGDLALPRRSDGRSWAGRTVTLGSSAASLAPVNSIPPVPGKQASPRCWGSPGVFSFAVTATSPTVRCHIVAVGPRVTRNRSCPQTWCVSGQAVNESGHRVILASLD